MNFAIAQTNIQLFNQLIQSGYSHAVVEDLCAAYELAQALFQGDYRGSGKTFLAHVIGVSSVLAAIGADPVLIKAGLLHAAYTDGQFQGAAANRGGISAANRQRLKTVIGPEAEAYVYEYKQLPWRQSGAISGCVPQIHTFDQFKRDLILMRLANAVEEHADLGILYCDNAQDRLAFLNLYSDSMLALAKSLDQPELSDWLQEVFHTVNTTQVHPSLRAKRQARYTYTEHPNAPSGKTLKPRAESSSHTALELANLSPVQSLSDQPSKPESTDGEPLEFKPFPRSETELSLVRRFEAQVTLHADRVAVKTADAEFTYAELNQAANQLARRILELGSPEQQLVPILFDQTADMVVAILGVLKAGKGWVPLSVSYPRVRLEAIISELDAGCIVSNQQNCSLAQQIFPPDKQIINLDALPDQLSTANLEQTISPDTIACVLYTSGSTGKPKGVIHSHRNLLHLIMRGTNAIKISAVDRISMLPSYSHMAGTNDMFRAILNGATLFPYDLREHGLASLSTWLNTERISIYHSVPTVFRHFMQTLQGAEQFPHLRLIHLGGETLAKADVLAFQQHFPESCQLLNNLGCTELSSYRQYFLTNQTNLPKNLVPVGYAPEDVEISLIDEASEAVPIGRTGEVVLRSRYLALGYWKKPDSDHKFTADPENPGWRCYRTGDLGYLQPDGCLVYLGRKDHQVQVRGYRVEVAEIEAALLEHNNIQEAAVKGYDNSQGEIRLVAHLVLDDCPSLPVEELRDFLLQRLPDYMVPAHFQMLSALPQTPNQKVDRLSLTMPQVEAALTEQQATEKNFVAPETAIERDVAQIWSEILEIAQISLEDNFFILGGDSIQAMRVVARVNESLNLELSIRSLFEHSTLQQWTQQIEQITWLLSQVSIPTESLVNETWEEIEL